MLESQIKITHHKLLLRYRMYQYKQLDNLIILMDQLLIQINHTSILLTILQFNKLLKKKFKKFQQLKR